MQKTTFGLLINAYISEASASLEMKLVPIDQLNACPEQVYLHLLLNVASCLQYINSRDTSNTSIITLRQPSIILQFDATRTARICTVISFGWNRALISDSS